MLILLPNHVDGYGGSMIRQTKRSMMHQTEKSLKKRLTENLNRI